MERTPRKDIRERQVR